MKFKSELQEKINQYLATLPEGDGEDWYASYKEFGTTVLNAFLWWLYPELKPKDLPSWQEWPDGCRGTR